MGSVRITSQLEEQVRQVAQKKGITRSEVFRRALEAYCQQELAPPQRSRFDDAIGIVDAPSNGSSRVQEYFVEGLTKKHG